MYTNESQEKKNEDCYKTSTNVAVHLDSWVKCLTASRLAGLVLDW